MKEQDIVDHIELVNKVAGEYLKGKNETEISKELQLARPRVVALVHEWKNMAANSDAVRARAREALAGADLHFSKLINEAYGVVSQANEERSLGQKTAALKLILDIEKSRIEILQKAGMLENRELAEKLLETEKKQEALMKVLSEVSAQCPVCKPKVLKRLSGFTTGGPMVIYES